MVWLHFDSQILLINFDAMMTKTIFLNFLQQFDSFFYSTEQATQTFCLKYVDHDSPNLTQQFCINIFFGAQESHVFVILTV